MIKNIFSSLTSKSLKLSQKIGSALVAPSEKQAQVLLFGAGVVLLSAGVYDAAFAQLGGTGNGAAGLVTTYNDTRFSDALNAILTYIEGTFGAMVMVASGIGAIMSAAFGQYRAALGLLVVAVGAFILRSLVGTFFNDSNIRA